MRFTHNLPVVIVSTEQMISFNKSLIFSQGKGKCMYIVDYGSNLVLMNQLEGPDFISGPDSVKSWLRIPMYSTVIQPSSK